jgi:hypothetical protein
MKNILATRNQILGKEGRKEERERKKEKGRNIQRKTNWMKKKERS